MKKPLKFLYKRKDLFYIPIMYIIFIVMLSLYCKKSNIISKIDMSLSNIEKKDYAIDYCYNHYRKELKDKNDKIILNSSDNSDYIAYEWDGILHSDNIIRCSPAKKINCLPNKSDIICNPKEKWNGEYIYKSNPVIK